MSRGALQGGRELRLRVRHKKPKRLLRSWYNLLGQDQEGSANGSDEMEEVQKDTKHRNNHHESKEAACKQLSAGAPPAAAAEHAFIGRTRLNGSSNHGAALLMNGRCHSQRVLLAALKKETTRKIKIAGDLSTPEPSAGKDIVPVLEDGEDEEMEQDSDLMCSVCNGGQSDPPNEIVICDTCNKGFHQACHTPKISDQVLLPNIPWHCRNCVPVGSVRKSAKNCRNGAPVQMFKLGFPYSMKSLQWDYQHRINTRNCYCYCGGPGVWNKKMLQCRLCQQWFHEACIQGLETPLLYGDSFYYFSCSVCNNGPEVVKRMPLCWMDITHLTLYNLVMEHHKKYYELDEEIMPYLNSIWLALQLPSDIFRCSMRERRSNIYDCLHGDSFRFKSGKEVKKRTSLWCLRDRTEPPDPRTATVLLRENKNGNVIPALSAKEDPTSAASGGQLFKKGPAKGVTVLPGRENGVIKRRKRKAHDNMPKGASAAGKSNKVPSRPSSGKAQPVQNGISPDAFASEEEDDESSSNCSTACSSTFLDSFIPAPDDFEGRNNPFRVFEPSPPPPALPPRPRPGRPRKIHPPPDEVGGPSDVKQQQPPRLKPNEVEVPKPTQSHRNSRKASCQDSNRIPKLQDSRTMPLARSDSDSDSSTSRSSSSSTSSTGTDGSSTGSRSNSVTTEECNVAIGTAPLRWKSALRSGEKCDPSKRCFSVLAKRVCADGKVQYLVEWDGATSRS